MEDNKKLIAIAAGLGVVLIILVILTSLFGAFSQRGKNSQTITPTPVFPGRNTGPTLTAEEKRAILETKQQYKMYGSGQSQALSNLVQKMPVTTDDFEMDYSHTLDQFFVKPKTDQADAKLNQYLKDNGLPNTDELNSVSTLIIKTPEPPQDAIKKAEEDFLKKKSESPQSQEQQQGGQGTQPQAPGTASNPSPEEEAQAKDMQLLTDLLKTLVSFNFGPEVGTESAGGPPPGGSTAPTALADIFNEAGQKVGIAPKLLQAFMQVECGRILLLPPEQIQEYSTPGNGLPPSHFCFGNAFGAHGPMQFINSTWAHYATAVNRYGGYTHTPYIENIRDSVYAAAEKIKNDGRASNPQSWTQEEVYRGAKAYCGSCDQARACPNYCAHVWGNYIR